MHTIPTLRAVAFLTLCAIPAWSAENLLKDPEFDNQGVWRQEVHTVKNIDLAGVTTEGPAGIIVAKTEGTDKFLRLERTIDNDIMYTVQTSQPVAVEPNKKYHLKLTGRSPEGSWVCIVLQKDGGEYEAFSGSEYRALPPAFGVVEADLTVASNATAPIRLSFYLNSGTKGKVVELTSAELVEVP